MSIITYRVRIPLHHRLEWLKKNSNRPVPGNETTVFPHIVSAEAILFWIFPYVLWPLITVHKCAETIQGRKLFMGGNYMRKYGKYYIIFRKHILNSQGSLASVWLDIKKIIKKLKMLSIIKMNLGTFCSVAAHFEEAAIFVSILVFKLCIETKSTKLGVCHY